MPTIRNTVIIRRKEPPKPFSWTPTRLFEALKKNEPLSVDVPAWMRALDVNCHHSLVMRLERGR